MIDLSYIRESPLDNELKPSPYFRWKRVVDFVLAAILLVPGIPIIGLLVILVRLTSPGPGIFRQLRVGKDGKTFRMYKIRTMTRDAEDRTGVVWAQVNDSRVTWIGRVLRKLHLDEFPQLFNVLNGEMSLIGPRPERPEFVHVLAKEIPGYLDRLAVLPGITGLAQINLEPDTDLDSVRCKLVLDLDYIRNAGLLLDARMFVCTFIRLLGFSGDCAMRIMRLHREVPDNGSPEAADGSSVQLPHTTATPVSIANRADQVHGGQECLARSRANLDTPAQTKPR
ncbi:MAG: sugar transferase [Pirellulales bacterium]|nr:sugar transferase [Pirellulales bacterium]